MGRVYFYLGGKMGLFEDLNNQDNFSEPVRMKCKLCELLKELELKERDALALRLADPKIGHTAIADVLVRNGFNVSRSAVSRHRKDTHVVK